MKVVHQFLANVLLGGVLVVLPIYLAVLVLLKGAQSVGNLIRPFTMLLPAWLPAENVLSLVLVLTVCFLIGVAVRTRLGKALRERMETSLFERLPGYALFRSLTQQLAGEGRENIWKPALVEIEEALVPAFIIEQFEDGRFTVFVPSVPTPLAGAVYILTGDRVHPLEVPFHTGDQDRLPLGIGFEGPGGGDDESRPVTGEASGSTTLETRVEGES